MSSTLERPLELRPVIPPTIGSQAPRVRFLLACGVAYGVVYVIANDGVAASLYDGYNRRTQAISELSATGAPTKSFLTAMLPAFSGLTIAFGIGVGKAARFWQEGRGRRALRVAGGLLVASGLSAPLWLLAPMSSREVIAAGEGTSSDTMHLVLSGLTAAFALSEIGFGAAAFGKRFRLYSILTGAVVVGFGGLLTALQSAKLEAGQPTPWLGLVERIGLYGLYLWLAVFAVAVYRRTNHGPGAEFAMRQGPPATVDDGR